MDRTESLDVKREITFTFTCFELLLTFLVLNVDHIEYCNSFFSSVSLSAVNAHSKFREAGLWRPGGHLEFYLFCCFYCWFLSYFVCTCFYCTLSLLSVKSFAVANIFVHAGVRFLAFLTNPGDNEPLPNYIFLSPSAHHVQLSRCEQHKL